jgi:hypothetical protein
MAHDIFISHSSKDKQAADAICHALEQNGIKCWIAPRDVNPGFEYAEELTKGIKNCKAFLLIFSKESNTSKPVSREIESAFRYEKTVIPFRIEDVEMRESLEYYLSNLHWLDAFPDDKEFDSLIKAVRNVLGLPQEVIPPAPEPVPIPEPAPIPAPEPVYTPPPEPVYIPEPEPFVPYTYIPKKSNKNIIIAVAALAVLIIAAGVTFFLLFANNSSSSGGGSDRRGGSGVIDSDIIGVWDLVNNDIYEMSDGSWLDPWGDEHPTYEFKSDGTFTVTNISAPYSGTYAINGNQITFIAGGTSLTSAFTISRNTMTFITDYSNELGERAREFTEIFERIR